MPTSDAGRFQDTAQMPVADGLSLPSASRDATTATRYDWLTYSAKMYFMRAARRLHLRRQRDAAQKIIDAIQEPRKGTQCSQRRLLLLRQ